MGLSQNVPRPLFIGQIVKIPRLRARARARWGGMVRGPCKPGRMPPPAWAPFNFLGWRTYTSERRRHSVYAPRLENSLHMTSDAHILPSFKRAIRQFLVAMGATEHNARCLRGRAAVPAGQRIDRFLNQSPGHVASSHHRANVVCPARHASWVVGSAAFAFTLSISR